MVLRWRYKQLRSVYGGVYGILMGSADFVHYYGFDEEKHR